MKYDNADVLILGEIHSLDDRESIESVLDHCFKSKPFDFILSEEIGSHVAKTKEECEDLIKEKEYSISERTYQYGIKYGVPVVGIDLWSVVRPNVPIDQQCRLREARMLNCIKEFRKLGRCVVLVGDTHLRRSHTRELGKPSVINELKRDSSVVIVRCPKPEIQ